MVGLLGQRQRSQRYTPAIMRLLSLTCEIRNPTSPVARCLRSTFRAVDLVAQDFDQQTRDATTLLPPGAGPDYPYALVGGGIDYRIKYYFAILPFLLLPAARSAQWWHSGQRSSDAGTALDDRVPFDLYGPGNSRPLIPRVVAELLTRLREFLDNVNPLYKRLEPEDEAWLCRYCCGLALVDRKMTAAHAGEPYALKSLKPGATLDDLWQLVPRAAVADVRQLSFLYYERHRDLFARKVDVAPHYVWEQRIGASADLLIDQTLIDIKTTTRPRLDPLWLYQVIAYVLLDVRDTMAIDRIGFYLARQGLLVTWDFEELLWLATGSREMTRERLRATLLSAIWATHARR